jgi:hypothetical protein
VSDTTTRRRATNTTAIVVWIFAIVEALAIGTALWLR